MRVGFTWLSRTSRRGNMPAWQGFRPASGVSEVPKTSTQLGTGIRSGSLEPFSQVTTWRGNGARRVMVCGARLERDGVSRSANQHGQRLDPGGFDA